MSKTSNQKRAALAAAKCSASLRAYGSGVVVLDRCGRATTIPSTRMVGTYAGDCSLDELAADLESALDALEGGSE